MKEVGVDRRPPPPRSSFRQDGFVAGYLCAEPVDQRSYVGAATPGLAMPTPTDS
jgi:hypothetical protein